MANREQRSNREKKKKPKADKNKKKDAPLASPFASVRNPTPVPPSYADKKT